MSRHLLFSQKRKPSKEIEAITKSQAGDAKLIAPIAPIAIRIAKEQAMSTSFEFGIWSTSEETGKRSMLVLQELGANNQVQAILFCGLRIRSPQRDKYNYPRFCIWKLKT